MSGVVVLHGGAELTPAGAAVDRWVLARTGPGLVVVCALASPPGAAYAATAAGGAEHLRSLGAEAVAAPDPRDDPGAVDLLASARLLVLPGGSPGRLLAALRSTGADAAVSAVLDAGGTVLGCSAGAMVLCSATVLPEEEPMRAAAGLSVVAPSLVAAVVPHWSGPRAAWESALDAVPGEVVGVPERAALVVDDGRLVALGAPVARLRSGSVLRPEAEGAG